MTLASLVWPLAGGLMIGTAAAVFLLWEGRVAGVSGLVAEASGISPASGRRAALLFVAGLVVAGMTDPNRVLAFLDVAGAWDPSLALVMLGALVPAGAAYHWMRGRNRTLTGLPVQLPVSTRIDLPLVAGALLFGTGWGLLGLCPGPAVAMLGTGQPTVLLFLVAMLLGMGLYQARLPRRVIR